MNCDYSLLLANDNPVTQSNVQTVFSSISIPNKLLSNY